MSYIPMGRPCPPPPTYLISGFYIGDVADIPSRIDNDFESWKRDYQNRLNEEKENDPTNIFGWAFKGFFQ